MLSKYRAAVLAGVCSLALAGPVAAETLVDALALAYQTNPQLQAQRARLRALDEQYVQTRAGYRPRADLGVTADLLDVNYNRPTPNPPLTPARNIDDVTTGEPTIAAQASASVPLYTGGRVGTALREVEANILSGREQLRALENDLYQGVIQVYADVRRDENFVRIREENVSVLRRQLEETRARFEVGEITRTDVAQAEARLAAGLSLLSQQQAALATSRANYASLVGQSPGTLEAEPVLPGLPTTVDQAYETAQLNNPDLLAAELNERASRARVARERAERRPSVGLTSTATYGRSLEFSGPLDEYGANLSAGATVSLPLYRGGATNSRVRAALQTNNADRISIETTRRQVVQQVAQAWNSLQAQRASVISNEEQVRAARVAFEGVQAEAQAGLRTTLDVLNAAAELRQAELDLFGSRRNAYVAGSQVLNAMGLADARNLTPGVETYDPAANFNRIRGKGFLPWEPIVETLDKVGAPPIEDRPVQENPTVAKKPATSEQAAAPAVVPAKAEEKAAVAGEKVASLDTVVDAALRP